jgi:hypothetical protein
LKKRMRIVCRDWLHKKYGGKKEDKSSDQGLSLNRSQYKSCSTANNPLTSSQVVYK